MNTTNTTPTPQVFRGSLRIISAGAAQSLVLSFTDLINRGANSQALQLHASFGAVGAMVDLFTAELAQISQGSSLMPCDLMISSQGILAGLGHEGLVQASTLSPLGLVSTGLARLGSDTSAIWGACPPNANANDHLVQTLKSATHIYIPDPIKSTAGIHVKAVLTRLGLWESSASKLQSFPNGAAAMAQLAKDARPGALGCTQKTEILFTQGVEWVEPLPEEHALKTLYSVVRCLDDSSAHSSTEQVTLAQAFLDQLVSPELAELRAESGFEQLGAE